MSERPGIIGQLGVTAEQIRTTAMVSTGIVLANILDRGDMVVHADDSLTRQAGRALQSALPAPEIGTPDHRVEDIGVDVAFTSLGLFAAQTTSLPGLAATAVGAQVAGCGVDAITDRSGWLTHAESLQEDVGFSSISVAWFTKFLLDKASQSKEKATAWYAGLATFAGTVALGLPLYEGSQGGKLDATSHLAGLGVGALAYKIGKWRASRRAAAAQTASTKIS